MRWMTWRAISGRPSAGGKRGCSGRAEGGGRQAAGGTGRRAGRAGRAGWSAGRARSRGGRQGLTLVHFSAQRKRCLWDRGCILGLFREYTGGAMGIRGCLRCVLFQLRLRLS